MSSKTIEQILEAELSEKRGYELNDAEGRNTGNSRKGHCTRKMRTSFWLSVITDPKTSYAAALGDLDALAAIAIGKPNRLWLNRGSGDPPLLRLPTPSGLVAVTVSTTRIDLTLTDNASDETSYRVERSQDGTANWVEIAVLPAADGSIRIPGSAGGQHGLLPGTPHRVSGDLYSAYSHLGSAAAHLPQHRPTWLRGLLRPSRLT